MTVEQHLLIRMYATQKIYGMRTLEMLAAIQETLESGKEPTGMLAFGLNADADLNIDKLVKKIIELQPYNMQFGTTFELDSDEIGDWLDKAADITFGEDLED